jgi:hypothetical protein
MPQNDLTPGRESQTRKSAAPERLVTPWTCLWAHAEEWAAVQHLVGSTKQPWLLPDASSALPAFVAMLCRPAYVTSARGT